MTYAPFTPPYQLISGVSNAPKCTVMTVANHGFPTGAVVRIDVPDAYRMSIYAQTKIVVTGANTFTTEIDTSAQFPFTPPSFSANGQAFTQAQVTPISGVEQNSL